MAETLEYLNPTDFYTAHYNWNTAGVYTNPANIQVEVSDKDINAVALGTDSQVVKVHPDKVAENHYVSDDARRGRAVQKEDKSPTWSDFMSSTTFHGVRYIFDKRHFKFRRFLWLVCVAVAILLFSAQVVTRAAVYFQYNTNVDVQVIYSNSLSFPAVTLCNQNNFRITETVDKGLYAFIDGVFSSEPDNQDMSPYHGLLGDTDTDVFILETAHQLDDFIERCWWNGKPCNTSSVFKPLLTDIGVCYVFNGEEDGHTLSTSQPGAKHGLRLILNVEQYEYMRGPQNDAGVKILLHDQSEAPLVSDLGFAIAPGMHTLVGVSRTEINGLEAPYGRCVGDAAPMSWCQLQCTTDVVVETCGCGLSYMPHSNEGIHAVCNMTHTYGCARVQTEKAEPDEQQCSCPVPCTRIIYEPSLSYAQLSKFNIERLSLPEASRRIAVEQKMLAAREVSQRVVSIIADEDHVLMSDVIDNHISLVDLLSQSSHLFNNSNSLARSLHLADVISLGIDVVKNDLVEVSYLVEDYHGKLIKDYDEALVMTLNELQGFYMDIYDFFSPNYSSSVGFISQLNTCRELGKESQYLPWWCQNSISMKKQSIRKWSRGNYHGNSAPKRISKFYRSDYEDLIHQLFSNTSQNPDYIADHLLCLGEVEYFINETEPSMYLLLEQLRLIYETSDMDQLLQYVQDLNETFSKLPSIVYLKERMELCRWPRKFSVDSRYQAESYAVRDEKTKYEAFDGHMQSALQRYSFLIPAFQKTCKQFNKLHTHYTKELSPVFPILESYLASNVTKQATADRMLSLTTRDALVKFYEYESLITAEIEDYTTYMADIAENIKAGFRQQFSLVLPVLNDQTVSSLDIWQDLIMPSNTDAIKEILANYSYSDRSESFQAMVDMIYTPFISSASQLSSSLSKRKATLKTTVDSLVESLERYVEANQMDDEFYMDNFMQVDIFYKELSHEVVEQQVAFELLSLFSEVGGFLGLLLGASVLTVCELIDYIVLKLASGCHRAGAMTSLH